MATFAQSFHWVDRNRVAAIVLELLSSLQVDAWEGGPRLASLYNWLIGLLFGWPHRDINFSFKLMKREVLEAIELKSEGSLIDAELVVKAKNKGFAIQQMGTDYFPRIRGTSSLASVGVILKIIRELIKLYPEMRTRHRR